MENKETKTLEETKAVDFKAKVLEIWGKRNDLVKPVIGWSVSGGVLAVAIGLALIFWL